MFSDDYYRSLSTYNFSLNIHTEIADNYAANLRLFESAALGTCLITEAFPNISDLFEIDKEILVYHSDKDCLDKIKFCIDNPAIAYQIGQNARQRALKSHNYKARVSLLLNVIETIN